MIVAIQEIRSYLDSPFSKDKVDFVINGSNDLDERESRERREDIAEEHAVFGLRLVSVEFLEGLIDIITTMNQENHELREAVTLAVTDPERFARSIETARRLWDVAKMSQHGL